MKSASLVLLAALLLVSASTPSLARGRRRGAKINKAFQAPEVGEGKKLEANVTSLEKGAAREGKLFSLFNIVTFVNAPCASNSVLSGSQRRNGTCLSSTECSDASGTASGNCAAGFGVCCLFLLSASGGGTITQNCTYIQNEGFPSALSNTNSVSYTVRKCSNDVCWLRLDFESFTILGTGLTTEANGGACVDTFDVTTTSTNQIIPQICGQNTGQHMYVDIGNQASDQATLAFGFTGSSTARTWEIKVTQVPCTSQLQPPDSCLQYHTGLTGRFTSFNFLPSSGETHLASQEYSVCVRQEAGFCCVLYSLCTDNLSFSLYVTNNAGGFNDAQIDSSCTEDYIIVEGSTGGATCNANAQNSAVTSRYCGAFLNANRGQSANVPVCDCSQPFSVGIVTDNTANLAVTANTIATDRGVCIEYMQVACNG